MSRPISFRAAAGRPCPVCSAESKGCSSTDDGLHFCRGGASVNSDDWHQIGAAADANGFLHFRRDDPASPNGSAGGKRRKKSLADWSKIAKSHASSMSDRHYAEFARRLSISEHAARMYPQLGWCEVTLVGTTFTVPEFDSTGRIVGIMKRSPPSDPAVDARDEQLMMKGGSRGLMMVTGWRDRGESDRTPAHNPVLIVEGASCALAAASAGLSSIGRPGNEAGREYLARILADWPADRPIIVLGENDEKPDGKWPGREGGEKLAQGLANDLTRTVLFALPPADAKDLRAWMTAESRAATEWFTRGAEFLTFITDPAAPHAAAYSPQATLERPRPQILITTEELAINNEAIAALAREPNIYQRGGMLVRAVQSPASKTKSLDLPNSLRILPFEKATLREVLANVAIWKKEIKGNEDSTTIDTHPPPWTVDAVLARGVWAAPIRNLVAVVDHPILRPDGTVLSAPGFDTDTELFVAPGNAEITLPARRLTITDATAAVSVLTDAVRDFPFLEPAHRSAWIAALLTPLCRFAFSGPSPLFLIDANAPGVGKGLLCDLISLIVTGIKFAVASYSHNNEEMEKCITAAAIAGDRLIMLDNITGLFGNAAMDKALTGTIWRGRLLGESRNIVMPLFATWYATGNNVQLSGDIARRIIQVKLNSDEENPDEREDFVHQNIRQWALDNRTKLLAAALTIPAAYIQSGRPRTATKLAQFGSFEGWSDLVRASLVWAGLDDPAANRTAIRRESDAELGAMTFVLEKWGMVDLGDCGITASDFIEKVFGKSRGDAGPDEYSELRDVLRSMLKDPNPRDFGYKLRKYQNRILGGRFLDSRKLHGVSKWAVKSAVKTQKSFKALDAMEVVRASNEGNASGENEKNTHDSHNQGCDATDPKVSHPASHPSQTLQIPDSGCDGRDRCDTCNSACEKTQSGECQKKTGVGQPIAPIAPSHPQQEAPPDGWLYVSRRLDLVRIHAADAPPVIDETPPGSNLSAPYYRLTAPVLAWFERAGVHLEAELAAGRLPQGQMNEYLAGMQVLWEFAEKNLEVSEVLAARAKGGELPAAEPVRRAA